jgi:undecaprenyl-diphosphatase
MELISRLNDWEASLIRRLVPDSPAVWSDAVMSALTRLGDGWLWGAVALAAVHTRSLPVFVAGAAACAAANLVFTLTKQATGRQRPCHRHRDLLSLSSARDYYSFPSGHSINAFAAATVLEAMVWPAVVPLLFVVAFGVAASRVYLRLHYPTDVLVGALLGRAVGALALALCL